MLKQKLKNTFIGNLYSMRKLNKMRKKWSRLHPGSDTIPMNIFNPDLVEIGINSYGELNVVAYNDSNKLKIGNYVSIAQEVRFLLNVEHYLDHISTYPFKVKVLKTHTEESFGKGDIILDDDCWIGYRATIMSGVRIGQGAVVAAGAVVTKNVPPYAIVGGVPAKIIKYRFSKEIIDKLLNVDYTKLDPKLILEHIDDLYKPLEKDNQFEWFPTK